MKECVLLDFDNTITTQDTSRILMIELIKLRPLRILGALWFAINMLIASKTEVTQKYKNRAIGYLISGLSDSDLSSSLLNFSERVKPLYRNLLINKIKEHDKNDVIILIVTASPNFAIDLCVSNLPVLVIGTVFNQVSGVYSGQIQGSNCYGQEKVSRIESWATENNLILDYIEAWSDDFSDYPMLKMAKERYWIGDESLRDLVCEKDPSGCFLLSEN